jgi:SAM-dependent methyltransferase
MRLQLPPRKSIRLCPVCFGSECVALHEQRFVLPEGHPLSNGYTVVSCEACGFVYADTDVTQAQFDRFYTLFSKYEDAQTGTGGGTTAWDQQRLRATAREISKFADRDARILDIGCANGGLLAELRGLGFTRLSGIDPSPACVRRLAVLNFPGWQGTLTRLPEQVGTFDCVILSHVLEHLLDLRASMSALSSLVSYGGFVYAEVPDASRYKDFVVAPFQDFNTEHINHFSSTCLTNVFGLSGFERTHGAQKEIASSADSLTPAVFGVYQRTVGENYKLVADASLRGAIQAYISGSRRLLEEINQHLRVALAGSGPVMVWGAGQLTMKLLCESVLSSRDVAAFVDSNPIHHGKVIQGVQVLSPEELRQSGRSEPIVIGSLLHGREIVAGIRERYGLPNRLIELRPGVRDQALQALVQP